MAKSGDLDVLKSGGPTIASFRGRLRDVLKAAKPSASRNDVVVFAVDGVPAALAKECWPGCDVTTLRSAFPTTSSANWLTSLTGASVDEHGVPGVMFHNDAGELIDVFRYCGPLSTPAGGNIFTDALDCGYTPVAVCGDWEPFDCTWRSALLAGAHRLDGHRFLTKAGPTRPGGVVADVRRAVSAARGLRVGPRLVWCFIDLDLRIHRSGYDPFVLECLAGIGRLAAELADQGVTAVAHSDHGLVPTVHRADVDEALRRIMGRHGLTMGGCGRTRWLYAGDGAKERVLSELRRDLPSCVRVGTSDEAFRPGSLAHRRVGAVTLMALGSDFIAFDGHTYDHGSVTPREMDVPLAVWPSA